MNNVILNNIKSIIDLSNGEKLAIANDNNEEKVCLLNKDNDIVATFNKEEAQNKIHFSYSYNNTKGDGIFWIGIKEIYADNIDCNIFVPFINRLKLLLSNRNEVRD